METTYTHLRGTLRDRQAIWVDSILQNWPSSRSHFSEAWLDSIRTLKPDDLRAFANGEILASLPDDLRFLMQELGRFEYLESEAESKLDESESQGLNRKKQHEIERLLPLLESEGQDLSHAVDIGGGMGHLARLCVKRFHWQFHSIDKDQALQTKGEWWLKRSRDLDRSKLIFVAGEFTEDPQDLDRYFAAPETLSLGLHTCGSLAVTQMRKSLGSERIINFGCCFDKTQGSDLNLSELARRNPIPWNQSSLFLATRGRKELSENEFALLRRVNDYRFALDLWFRRFFPERGFLIAGDAPKALYSEDFAGYAADRLKKLGLPETTPAKLAAFYEEAEIQSEVFAIFAAHLVRNIFARPLEILLILDRALWLRDQGFDTEIQALFDRRLSPRNLALIARRPRVS